MGCSPKRGREEERVKGGGKRREEGKW